MRRRFRISVLMMVLGSVLTGSTMLTSTRLLAAGEIVINQDGSVVGTDKIERNGPYFIFKASIHDPVRVLKSNIVIDGAGYLLEGSGKEKGFTLLNVYNVTIKNLTIKTFNDGISVEASTLCNVAEVNLTLNFANGIVLVDSANNNISRNKFSANKYNGILLDSSSNNTISGNTIADNNHGIALEELSSSNIITGNTITGNNGYGIALPNQAWNNTVYNNTITSNGFGIALFDDASGNTVSGNTVTDNKDYGILLYYSRDNTVSGNTITANNVYGIMVYNYSRDNTVSGNTVANNGYGIIVSDYSRDNTVSGNTVANNEDGILFLNSSSNTISGNTIKTNNFNGIILDNSSSNTISSNTIKGNRFDGIRLYYSSTNSITGNNITNNDSGIALFNYSNGNTISGNTIADNDSGMWLEEEVRDNSMHHNDFVNNTAQAIGSQFRNTWDSPSGGNYWSDYEGVDQNGDGIGDTLTPHHEDRYPFIVPIRPIPIFWKETEYYCIITGNVTVSKFLVGTGRTTSFNVTGHGYVNVTFPKEMLDGSFKVFVNNTQVPCMSCWSPTQISVFIECASLVTTNVKVEAEFKLLGDVNCDGRVNIIDISLVAKRFGNELG